MTRRDVGRGIGTFGAVGLAIISVVTVARAARSEDSFRCPSPSDRVIRLGDPLYEARGTCGTPAHVVQRKEKEKVGLKARHISSGGSDFIDEREITVEVEEWYFDLGRNRPARLLRFENGRLATITTGQYSAGPEVPDAGAP